MAGCGIVLNFFLRNPFGKAVVYLIISAYEICMNLAPEVIVSIAVKGETFDWASIVSSHAFWITVVIDIIFSFVIAGVKYADKKEMELYSQDHIQHYLNETTEIALTQLRDGKPGLAKKTMALQERHMDKVRRK